MIRSGLLAVTICAALASGLFGVGICSADPGPMDPGYCGARQDPLDCVPYDGPMPPPPNRGEAIFLNNVRDYFIGNTVLLSDGREAEVVYLGQYISSRPVVRTEDGLFIDLEQRKELSIVRLLGT